MTRRLGLIAAMLSASVLASGVPISVVSGFSRTVNPGDGGGLVAHEWGTFTSIAGENGRAIQWLPQAGPTDLPCFVERINTGFKSLMPGTVRMETPVIYFYAPQRMSVDVSVRFRQGVITEWFPRPGGTTISPITAAGALRGELVWKNVEVVPDGSAQFPLERELNHYYVARETDAAPLHVGAEQERFLFYRGVGRLPPPIGATVSDAGQISVTHTRGAALGDIILFENRDGATAYGAIHTSSPQVIFNPMHPEGKGPSPQKYLEQLLVAHGLYAKEAKAMVESWRDSWFEQGTRLFYIVSNEAVDAILPLQIDPQPAELKRVFVGRLEIATPETLNEVKVALDKNDRRKLAQYGRFLEPIARRLLTGVLPAERTSLERSIQSAYAQWSIDPGACGRSTN